MTSPSVSVVIPSYNEATYIDRLLEALSKQDYPNFEVIVSDAESKDGTKEVVKNFENKLDVSLVSTPPKGPSAGRNEGAKRAKGEWLLFLDADDDIDDPKFIETLIKTCQAKNWQTCTAKIKLRGDASLKERFGTALDYYYIKLLAHTKHPVAPGWCIMTKRDLFEKNNGFNEKIHFGEDYDYVTRVGRFSFGFVDETAYFLDLRRPRAEGWRLTIKAIANEIYRHTHHYNLENNPNKYEFGKHQKRESN